MRDVSGMKKIIFILMLEYFASYLLLLFDGGSEVMIYYFFVSWSFLNLLAIPSILIVKNWLRKLYVFSWVILFLIQILLFCIHSIWPEGEVPTELLLLISLDSIPAIFQYHLRYLFLIIIGGCGIGGIYYCMQKSREILFSFISKKIWIIFSFFNFFFLITTIYIYDRGIINCIIQNYAIIEEKRINFSEYENYGAHFPFSDNPEKIEAHSGHNLIHIILESTEKNFLDEELFPDLCPELKKWSRQGILVEDMDMAHNATLTFGGIYAAFTGKWLSPYSRENDVFLKAEGNSISFPLILKKAGYEQIFIYGHKNAFGGFESYLEKQGFSPKRIESAHQEYEADEKVFSEALKEFKRLSAQKKPFNLTLLTVNAHASNGMILKNMKLIDYPNKIHGKRFDLLDVIHTTDAALGNFLDEVAKDQNFKNTTIVIQSDHLAHPYTIPGVLDQLSLKPRKMLFVILNSSKNKEIVHPAKTFDIAPTILSAMNVKHNVSFLFGEDLFNEKINKNRLFYSSKQERINSYYYKIEEIKNISIENKNNNYYLSINNDTVPILFSGTQLPYQGEFDNTCFLPISSLNTYTSVMYCYNHNFFLNSEPKYLLYGVSGEKEKNLLGVKIPPFSRYLILKKDNGDIIYRIGSTNNLNPIEISL